MATSKVTPIRTSDAVLPATLPERMEEMLTEIGAARAIMRTAEIALGSCGGFGGAHPHYREIAPADLDAIAEALRAARWRLDVAHNDLDVEREQLEAQS